MSTPQFAAATATAPSAPSSGSFVGQPWFLSVVSGVLGVLLYRYLLMRNDPSGTAAAAAGEDDVAAKVQNAWLMRSHTKSYVGVFLVVAFLVYGSFMVSISQNVCKLVCENIPIQTGGSAPF